MPQSCLSRHSMSNNLCRVILLFHLSFSLFSPMASATPGNLAKLVIFMACFLFVLLHGTPLEAVEDGDGGGMRSEELLGLFEVMSALLEDQSWAELHPHPCTDTPWPGIQCEMVIQGGQQQDPYLHVTKLHIGSDVASPPCKASAKLSESILKLPYLKALSLFSCFLGPGSLFLPPSLFTNTSRLEQLAIKSNPGLTGEIPSTIARLQSMRVLILSQNNLHGGVPKELGTLGKLEQLDLSYNHLTGRIPVEIAGLSSLTIFDLSWNVLQGEIPRSLGELQSLQKVDLSSNKLSGRIPADMGKLGRLVLLDLSHNSLTGPIPDSLSDMVELQYFLAEDNPIDTGVPRFLGSLRKLVVLSLSGCGLFGPLPASFGSLTNLISLSLDRNRLNGTVPPGLGGLPNLGQLNLSQNQLSGELVFSEEFVSRLGKSLDVRDNKGLCAGPRMHQNLPVYLEAPPCLDSLKASNGSWSDDPAAQGSAAFCLSSLLALRSNLPICFLLLVVLIIHY